MVKQSNHELPGVNHIVYQNSTIDMQKNDKIPLTTEVSYISTPSFHRLLFESGNSKKIRRQQSKLLQAFVLNLLVKYTEAIKILNFNSEFLSFNCLSVYAKHKAYLTL